MANAGGYWRYLDGFELGPINLLPLRSALRAPLPKPLDGPAWNRLGVLGLIALSQGPQPDKGLQLLTESARAFRLAADLGYPPAIAHLALSQALLGDRAAAIHTLMAALPTAMAPNPAPPGPIFLPTDSIEAREPSLWAALLEAPNAGTQGQLLLGAMLSLILPFFLGELPHRLLSSATRCLGHHSATPWLKLGLNECHRGLEEGILALHRAKALRPSHPQTTQALYCAYLDRQSPERAEALAGAHPELKLPRGRDLGSPLPFPLSEGSLLAPPTLKAITQPILLGLGRYFEDETAFIGGILKPGMTFMDVGANLGVYALRGARAVGPKGKVIALEPWNDGAEAIKATAQGDGLSQLTVLKVAGSQVNRIAPFSRPGAPELGRILPMGAPEAHHTTVRCKTLDTIAEEEGLGALDVLKVDVEGHELAVLRGARGLIEAHQPIIIYENRAGTRGWNKAAALYLKGLGYGLHRYDPALGHLVPCVGDAALASPLNLVALPRGGSQ